MADYALTKSRRLLTPLDYSAVFDGADYKVSDRSVLVLAINNELGYSRLGLVMAKKNIRLAVQRNRIKRQIRESFRTNDIDRGSLDIVVLARRGLDQMENEAVRSLLSASWDKLLAKAAHAAHYRLDAGKV